METRQRYSFKTRLQKYIYILSFLLYIMSISHAFGPDSSLASGNNDTEPTVSSTPVYNAESFTCANLINSKQRNMCFDTPGLLQALIESEKLAKENCQEQFKDERWNCSGFAMLTESNVTKYATKEAAYLYAIMTSALAHTITSNCYTDETLDCPCGSNLTQTSDTSLQIVKEKCPYNYEYGAEIASSFMSKKQTTGVAPNSQQRVNLQNIDVGATTFLKVNNENEMRCTCAGVSASCLLMSCEKVLENFYTIATILKNHYNDSCKVSVDVSSLRSQCGRPITNTTLIHATSSPDYCHRDVSKGSYGVRGRSCDATSGSKNYCGELCCGRGHIEHSYTVVEECCKYVWCCTVECKPCKKKVVLYYTCK